MVTYIQEDRTNNYSIVKRNKALSEEFNFCVQTELRKLNLLQNKHIPKQYLINSTENRLLLLAGIIDSDGYYSSEFNCFEIIQKVKNWPKK